MNPDTVLCLSHLRWGFVYQRPQHLLSRFARDYRVFFVEEPFCDAATPRIDLHKCPRSGVNIVAPHIPEGLGADSRNTIMRLLLNNFRAEHSIADPLLWYYTPMALEFSRHVPATLVAFDCMDELSAFKGAPPELKFLEAELLKRADVVFTGGQSLYEAKLGRHDNLHCFPSSIEYDHFARARQGAEDPADQAAIPHPRIGYCGVIDERMNLELLDAAAAQRPDLHFVMIGPVVKIDASTLPQRANIHWLGGKSYEELPAYLANQDAAMLPFALNESTRFISPTKTPEYLAAGLPVVSTPITDVVRPYGELQLVRIAADAADFVNAIDHCIKTDKTDRTWLPRVDEFLSRSSWDLTYQRMKDLIGATIASRRAAAQAVVSHAVVIAGD